MGAWLGVIIFRILGSMSLNWSGIYVGKIWKLSDHEHQSYFQDTELPNSQTL